MNTSMEEQEGICSLQDMIDNQTENHKIATAVLGASDARNCSYDRGYVDRQALYSCITCLKETNMNLHAICLACSYACHQNHELYELYTKRNIRCDCGNKKFPSGQTCKLRPIKEDLNLLNKYNHNFKGLYCTCERPYPDPECEVKETDDDDSEHDDNDLDHDDDDDDEKNTMIQCTICEDWYHFEHLLGNEAFKELNSDYDEMICHSCMNNNQFLWYYQKYIPSKLAFISGDTNQDANVLAKSDLAHESCTIKCFLSEMKLKYLTLKVPQNQACYFLNGWREALCKCDECMKLYERHQVLFITRTEDTIKYYEEKGKKEEQEREKVEENQLLNQELSKLNRVAQIEVLHDLNNFKQELRDFLLEFAEKGEVVKRENVDAFFEELNARKRQKSINENTNYYCK